MKEAREFEGKTIDEAIDTACRELQVLREKLNIEILSEGTQGLFGLVGAKKARIRASLISLDFDTAEMSMTAEPPSRPEPAPVEKKQAPDEKKQTSVEKKPAPGADEQAGNAELEAQARELLQGMLEKMGFDFPVSARNTEEYLLLSIEGDGSGILIGRGGQTLDAMQYVLNKALVRNGREGKRIVLDTENYREKKEKNLIALAEKLGEKVKKTRKPITLNPMNAHDRRVVHLALQNIRGLVTKSRGDGAMKKVVIIPSRKK
ncbi:MAG: protein jag [Deltaproteobacteria bacterium]|nr:protein jag [Deltaproteobacteria bacterium]